MKLLKNTLSLIIFFIINLSIPVYSQNGDLLKQEVNMLKTAMASQYKINTFPGIVDKIYLSKDQLPVFLTGTGTIVGNNFRNSEYPYEGFHYEKNKFFLLEGVRFYKFGNKDSFIYSRTKHSFNSTRLSFYCENGTPIYLKETVDNNNEYLYDLKLFSSYVKDFKLPEGLQKLLKKTKGEIVIKGFDHDKNALAIFIFPYSYNYGKKKKKFPLKVFITDGSKYKEYIINNYPFDTPDWGKRFEVTGCMRNPVIFSDKIVSMSELVDLPSFNELIFNIEKSILENKKEDCLKMIRQLSLYSSHTKYCVLSELMNLIIKECDLQTNYYFKLYFTMMFFNKSFKWYSIPPYPVESNSLFTDNIFMEMKCFDPDSNKIRSGVFQIDRNGSIYFLFNMPEFSEYKHTHTPGCGCLNIERVHHPIFFESPEGYLWVHVDKIGLAKFDLAKRDKLVWIDRSKHINSLGKFFGCDKNNNLYYSKPVTESGRQTGKNIFSIVKPGYKSRPAGEPWRLIDTACTFSSDKNSSVFYIKDRNKLIRKSEKNETKYFDNLSLYQYSNKKTSTIEFIDNVTNKSEYFKNNSLLL